MSLDRSRWSAEVITKAEQLVAEGRVHRDPDQGLVFWVHGSREYRVQTDGESWITCTCPNGQHGEPTCYHSAAALMVVRDARTTDARLSAVGLPPMPHLDKDASGGSASVRP